MKKSLIMALLVITASFLLVSCSSKCDTCPAAPSTEQVINFQTGSYPLSTYDQSMLVDCYLDELVPATFNGTGNLYVGVNGTTRMRAYLKFNIQGWIVPTTVKVKAAFITFTLNGWPGTPFTVKAYGLTRHVINPAWQLYDTVMTQYWTNPGGDYDTAAAGGDSIYTIGNNYMTVPVSAALVQKWITDDYAYNMGVLIKQVSEPASSGDYYSFYGNEDTNPLRRPKLTVYYTLD